MRSSIAFLIFMLLASPAFAVNDWGYTGCSSLQSVGSTDDTPICFDFNSALSPASTSFAVKANSALVCLRPDVATIGVKNATAVIYLCPNGTPTSKTTCGIQAGTTASVTLDGTNGVPSTQTACVPVGPGTYFVDFPVLPVGGEIGLLTVQGGK